MVCQEKVKTGLVIKLVKEFDDNFEVLYAKNHPGYYHILYGGEIEDRLFTREEVALNIEFYFCLGYELLHGPLDMFI